jgi:hypothetical protein
VSIAGVHFTGANAVHFGGASATSFTVVSDTLITAVAPANRAGSVDITVVTGTGGQSVTSAADQFKFVQVCVVPKLKGKTLKAARKALMNAHCSLGGVLPKGQTTGTAKHQSRKRGKILPAGTKVNITLG